MPTKRRPLRNPAACVSAILLLSGCAGGSSSPPLTPTTQAFSATTFVGQPVTLNVLAHDTDPYGGMLTVQSASVSSGGTATVATDGQITFTPAAGFSGPATVTYTVGNAQGGQAPGQVTVTVTPVSHSVLASLTLPGATARTQGVLVLLAEAQRTVIDEVTNPSDSISQPILSPARRYLAYRFPLGSRDSLRVADLSSTPPKRVVNASDGSGAVFTADESQVWFEVSTNTPTTGATFNIVASDLPSGSSQVVAQIPSNSYGGGLAFAAGDTRAFYSVVNVADASLSGVFWMARSGPWTPQRVTPQQPPPPPQSPPPYTDTNGYAVDAAGDRVLYLLQQPGNYNPTSVWTVNVADPASATALLTNAPGTQAWYGFDALTPDGNLAFLGVTGIGIGGVGAYENSWLCQATQAPCWQGSVPVAGETFSGPIGLAIRADSGQAAVSADFSSTTSVGTLTILDLKHLNQLPQTLDTTASGVVYTADSKWLVYRHQDPSDGTGASARVYAWGTYGSAVPFQLGPNINEPVTAFAVAQDSRTVAFTTMANDQTKLYLVDITAPAYALPVPLSASDSSNLVELYGVL